MGDGSTAHPVIITRGIITAVSLLSDSEVAIPSAPLYITRIITLSTVVNFDLLFKSRSIYDNFVNTFLILIYLQISIYKTIILSIVLYVHEACFSHEGKNIEHSIDD
jgi:hypothetical protein